MIRSLQLSRTNLEVIAIGKIVIQVSSLAEQSSTRGASVTIDHLLLHRVLDEVALVLGSAVVLRQELRHLFRSAIGAIHLAQLHRGRVASLALLVSSAASRGHARSGPSTHTNSIAPCTRLHCDTPGSRRRTHDSDV